MSPWIASARWDLLWLHAPAFLPLLLVCLVPGWREAGAEPGPWMWLLLVIGVDVAHVYATLWLTYLAVPAGCLLAGMLLHRASPPAFWRALAYLAVLHFVRQQVGLVRLYARKCSERSRLDDAIDRAAVYAAALYPLLWWPCHPRRFAWFLPGDFVRLPENLWMGGAVLWALALGAFGLRQLRRFNPGKALVVYGTAAAWWGGIVAFDSDTAFTATNVVAHGIPYMALVWLYGNRKWTAGWRAAAHRTRGLAVFAGLLLALAFLEEGAWDALVWREHGMLFGRWGLPRLGEAGLSLAAALLAVPQTTHYLLDALIWRFDERANPGLARLLLRQPSGARASASV
jgi:hypothetical protein